MLKIRTYQDQDHDAAVALWGALTLRHREIYDDPSIGGQEGEYFNAFLSNPARHAIWVAEMDGAVVGMAALLVRGEEGEIDELVVLPEHRRQGIGSRLIATAVETAKGLNLKYLSIRPAARNVDALRLYAALGFRLVGQIELFQDLRPHDCRTWKQGLTIFGEDFGY